MGDPVLSNKGLGEIDITEVFSPLLLENKRYKVYYGGRGGGKSVAFAIAILIRCIQEKTQVLCTREFQNSIQDSVHRTFTKWIDIMGVSSHFEIQNNVIKCFNGSVISFQGLKRNITSIKSMEGIDICWCEEAENISAESWEILIPTIRQENSQIWISFNPRREDDPTYEMFVLNPPKDIILRKVCWQDNPFFPNVLDQERLACKERYPNKYRWIWDGECQQGDDDALWKHQDFVRVDGSGSIKEIIERYGIWYIAIGVDPAVSYSERSDSTGIVVAGIGRDNPIYVLADLTIHTEVNEWIHLLHNTYARYGADIILAEKNQGGDLIQNNLKHISRHFKYEGVTASKDKISRANEITFLYEEGLVKHVGELTELEYEMCTYTGGKNEKSPDRLDALVHVLKYLSAKIHRGNVKLIPSKPQDTVGNRMFGKNSVW